MSHETLALLQGTADLLILQALRHGPAHGYAVSRWVRERTEGALSMEDAALYQALHRLEARAWVASEWGLSENNRRAKFYALTPAGRKRLARETKEWHQTADLIAGFFAPRPEAS